MVKATIKTKSGNGTIKFDSLKTCRNWMYTHHDIKVTHIEPEEAR